MTPPCCHSPAPILSLGDIEQKSLWIFWTNKSIFLSVVFPNNELQAHCFFKFALTLPHTSDWRWLVLGELATSSGWNWQWAASAWCHYYSGRGPPAEIRYLNSCAWKLIICMNISVGKTWLSLFLSQIVTFTAVNLFFNDYLAVDVNRAWNALTIVRVYFLPVGYFWHFQIFLIDSCSFSTWRSGLFTADRKHPPSHIHRSQSV